MEAALIAITAEALELPAKKLLERPYDPILRGGTW
jgi:hypothetical protein